MFKREIQLFKRKWRKLKEWKETLQQKNYGPGNSSY